MTRNLIALGISAGLSLLAGLRLDGGLVSIDWDALSRTIPEVLVVGIFIWYTLKKDETTRKVMAEMSGAWLSSIDKLVTDHRAASEKRDDVTVETLKLVSKSIEVFSDKLDGVQEKVSDLSSGLEMGMFRSILDEDDNNGADSIDVG